ncbi:MAG: hypothetical protein E7022_06850 [Desulfovibrio desulfuricans]|nr:hypothetical protein [Desulfovibrio desulfuricans]
MRAHSRFRRILTALVLAAVCMAAGCAPQGSGPSARPSGGNSADGLPVESSLPRMRAESGQSVHVAVSGGDAAFNSDLESMLTGYLQSERNLVPAETAREADIVLRVTVEDIYSLGSRNAPLKAGTALGSTATGTMLGALLGGAVGGRSGLGWGAGGGALLGLGAALWDSSGKTSVWGMKALVGAGRSGREPATGDMHRLAVRAEGERMDRKDILPALEDALCRAIIDAFGS